MTATRLVLAMLLAVVTAPLAFAQGNPTGTISGRVLSDAGPLPGVTVTATSPNLQGTRSAVTSDNGDYIIPLLPPGDYTLNFELQGFRTLQQTTSVAVGQTVEIWVSAPNFNTKVARITLKKGKQPAIVPYCVLPGSTKVQKTCS